MGVVEIPKDKRGKVLKKSLKLMLFENLFQIK